MIGSPLGTISQVLQLTGNDHITSAHEMFQHVAAQVTSHEQFSKLLGRMDHAQRKRAYEALRPHLKFAPRPLDAYVAMAGELADAMKLPTLCADEKTLKAWTPAELKSDGYVAQEAVKLHLSKHYLRVTCRKCTREAKFSGTTKAEAIFDLRRAGWMFDEVTGNAIEICPDCPTSRVV